VALVYIVINSLLSALAGYVEGRQRHTSGRTPVAVTQVETGMGVL
jgi:hypothetical protein